MSIKTLTEKEILNSLYSKYGLVPDDVFSHKHYKIITRAGIEKIQAALGIKVSYSVIHKERHSGGLDVAIKAIGIMRGTEGDEVESVETFGEASPENTTQKYPFAMAEKRAMSRAVLKLAGLYEQGFFGEDEADDFKKSNNRTSSGNVVVKS